MTAIESRSKRYGLLLPATPEQAAGVSAGDRVQLQLIPDRHVASA